MTPEYARLILEATNTHKDNLELGHVIGLRILEMLANAHYEYGVIVPGKSGDLPCYLSRKGYTTHETFISLNATWYDSPQRVRQAYGNDWKDEYRIVRRIVTHGECIDY